MTEIKQNGLVIAERELGDNDKLLTILTERFGKLCVIGKGVKSVKNRHMATTQLFSYASFGLRKRGNFYYITDSDLIENYYDIRNDIQKLALASYICDVVCDVTAEDKEDDEILRLGLNTLFAIAKDIKPLKIIKACFELRIASECGFMPDLTACSKCGETMPNASVLDILDGVIVCDKCRKERFSANVENVFFQNGYQKPIATLTISTLSAMRYVINAEQERFLSFNLGEDEWDEFCEACEKYLLNQLERGFYSLEFYKTLL